MRNKPKSDWHNFDFSDEKRFGEIEVAISFNAEVLKRFVEFATDRVNRNTGIRFKLVMESATETVHKKEGTFFAVQAFHLNPYIFPNESPHTDRYDSRYNRVELYFPKDIVEK